MLGSLVYAGGLPLEVRARHRARSTARCSATSSCASATPGPQPCPARPPHAYVELHIEQGPVLEAEGVDDRRRSPACRASRGPSSTITGQSNHAGTTPMDHAPRRRATSRPRSPCSCARSPSELGPPQVATVGRIELHPNLVNVVAARATLTVDLRHTDDAVLARRRARGCTRSATSSPTREGVTIDAPIARPLRAGRVRRRGDRPRRGGRRARRATRRMRMPSGAGHDAQMLARVCPAGMVFVPERRRHQPQPGRAHRRRRPRGGRQRAAPRAAASWPGRAR